MILHVRERFLPVLRSWEGVSPHAYRDVAEVLTIGVGHRLTRSELMSGKLPIGREIIQWRQGLSDAQIETLLAQDLEPTERSLAYLLTTALSPQQFEALTSWAFNCGIEAVRGSTLRRLLNLGRYETVPAQLRRWIYAGGEVIEGLRQRREHEIAWWLGGGGAPDVSR